MSESVLLRCWIGILDIMTHLRQFDTCKALGLLSRLRLYFQDSKMWLCRRHMVRRKQSSTSVPNCVG